MAPGLGQDKAKGLVYLLEGCHRDMAYVTKSISVEMTNEEELQEQPSTIVKASDNIDPHLIPAIQ